MRESRVISVLKVLLVLLVAALVVAGALRLAVGTDGIGLTFVDVIFVPGEWFDAREVLIEEPTTVTVGGVVSGLTWSVPPEKRTLLVSGSTLVLEYAGETATPVAADGSVRFSYSFPQSQTQQAAGWQVVRVQQGGEADHPATAFVIVDLTRRVWLKRTGLLNWDEVPLP